jgi:hypothetical protein
MQCIRQIRVVILWSMLCIVQRVFQRVLLPSDRRNALVRKDQPPLTHVMHWSEQRGPEDHPSLANVMHWSEKRGSHSYDQWIVLVRQGWTAVEWCNALVRREQYPLTNALHWSEGSNTLWPMQYIDKRRVILSALHNETHWLEGGNIIWLMQWIIQRIINFLWLMHCIGQSREISSYQCYFNASLSEWQNSSDQYNLMFRGLSLFFREEWTEW